MSCAKISSVYNPLKETIIIENLIMPESEK
jgi:hypothetical protein